MDVTTYDRAEPFLERASAFLLAREAENGLPLGIALAVKRAGSRALFAVASGRGDEVEAVALQTPPHGLVLTRGPDPALRAIAERLRELAPTLPGVVGPEAAAAVFAQTWCEAAGCVQRVRYEQRCYQATRLTLERRVAGALRPALASDVPFVAAAIAGFAREVGVGPTDQEPARLAAAARIEARELYLWDDGQPVSVAGLCRETPGGISVNAVFTPPELRGRGYAQACVAAASQLGLDRGKRFVCLYADRTNAISNRVYLNIGFRPVVDVLQLDFVLPDLDQRTAPSAH